MTEKQSPIEAHYTVGQLAEKILAALGQTKGNLDSLNPADLAAVDEFHTRGGEATRQLAQLVNLQPGVDVLDIGSGLGGSARYLAHEHECQVVGVDLTEEYCQVATLLSQRMGLSSKTEFRQGSALELPCQDESFDLAWTEHVQMNIEDKAKFYGEIARVLRPGGKLAFHDIFLGPEEPPIYPAPWAGDASISFLIPSDRVREILPSQGFSISYWEDTTKESQLWMQNASKRVGAGPPPLGLHLLMGDDAGAKFGNQARNLAEDRVAVVQAVLTKGG